MEHEFRCTTNLLILRDSINKINFQNSINALNKSPTITKIHNLEIIISKYCKILSEIKITKNPLRLQALLTSPKNSHTLPCTLQRDPKFLFPN